MNDLEPLDGSPELLDALRDVLEVEEDLFGWAHNQEHFFQHTEYCGLVKLFDHKVTEARDRRRPVLNRIFQLGGVIDGVVVDPEASLKELAKRMRAGWRACQVAMLMASNYEDATTYDLLRSNQSHLERCIEKVERKLAKKPIIGEQLWLDRLV